MLKNYELRASYNPLNEAEKTYIRENYGRIPVSKIREYLRRDIVIVYIFIHELKEQGYKPMPNTAGKVAYPANRRTREGHWVGPHDKVWEIVYKYYNAEYSVPRPEHKKAQDVPIGVRIWESRTNCERAIRGILKHPKPSGYVSPLRYLNLID